MMSFRLKGTRAATRLRKGIGAGIKCYCGKEKRHASAWRFNVASPRGFEPRYSP